MDVDVDEPEGFARNLAIVGEYMQQPDGEESTTAMSAVFFSDGLVKLTMPSATWNKELFREEVHLLSPEARRSLPDCL
jgi:hypothetical protein